MLPALRRTLGQLIHIGREIPQSCRLILANGMIMSKMNYGIKIWGGTHKKHIKKIQALINRTARWITGAGRREKINKLMTECGWLKFEDLVQYQTIISLWKIIRLETPGYMKDKIRPVEDNKVETQLPRLMTTTLSFRWRTTRSWNSMPNELRSNTSLPRFKKQLKKWLMNKKTLSGTLNADSSGDEHNTSGESNCSTERSQGIMNIPSSTENTGLDILTSTEQETLNIPTSIENETWNIPTSIENKTWNIPTSIENTSSDISIYLDIGHRTLDIPNYTEMNDSDIPTTAENIYLDIPTE